MTIPKFLALAALMASATASCAQNTPENAGQRAPLNPHLQHRIGMNLSSNVDYSSQFAFADLWRSARPWTPDNSHLNWPTTEDGTLVPPPGKVLDHYLLTDLRGWYPAGKYVITWQGEGEVEARKFNVKREISRGPGRLEIEIEPSNNALVVTIARSNPDNPIRDLHVWMPGTEDLKSVWNPAFLERLKGFEALRFMDFGEANNSTLQKWSERPKPSDARWNNHGVPLEIQIELANTLETDAWFCVPHLADDDYVREMARLIKANLKPEAKAYIELSNEIWNGMFAQSRYAEKRGVELGLDANGFTAKLNWQARRSKEIFAIFDEVFGAERENRVVRVLAGQAGNPWVAGQLLSFENAGKSADAIAIAPYFGHWFGDAANTEKVLAGGLDGLFEGLSRDVDGENLNLIKAHAKLARDNGLELIAYEGGQHLSGTGGAENNDKLTSLFHRANTDARMKELYFRHHENWVKNGGGLYAAFAFVAIPSKWGSWGTLRYLDEPLETAPKFAALREILDAQKGQTAK